LTEKINFAEDNYNVMKELAAKAKTRARTAFNWDTVAEEHEKVFQGSD